MTLSYLSLFMKCGSFYSWFLSDYLQFVEFGLSILFNSSWLSFCWCMKLEDLLCMSWKFTPLDKTLVDNLSRLSLMSFLDNPLSIFVSCWDDLGDIWITCLIISESLCDWIYWPFHLSDLSEVLAKDYPATLLIYILEHTFLTVGIS